MKRSINNNTINDYIVMIVDNTITNNNSWPLNLPNFNVLGFDTLILVPYILIL